MPIRAPLKDNNAGADPGFQVRGGALNEVARNYLGYFMWKNHDFTPKKIIIFLPILGGGGCAPAMYTPQYKSRKC